MKNHEALINYLKYYGEDISIQSAADALFDPQLKSLSLPLAIDISKFEKGTIIDIGCGNGIILKRLSNLDQFKQKNEWIYLGIDDDDKLTRVLELAVKLRIHRRVEVYPLNDFYNRWPDENIAPKPYIGIVRNVLHELDIDITAFLLHNILNYFSSEDILYLQDLEVFPVAERGYACWLSSNLKNLLDKIGFLAEVVKEPSKKGNRWFTFRIERNLEINPSLEMVWESILDERSKQFNYWEKLGWLLPDDKSFRDVKLAKLDFDLQVAALQKQLRGARPNILSPLTSRQESEIIKAAFAKALYSVDLNALSNILVSFDGYGKFRNRGHHQMWLEKFLLDKSASIAVLVGGPFFGKTMLVTEVLSGRSYDKIPITLDIQVTSSVWNLLEQFLSALRVRLSSELLKGLTKISFNDIKNIIRKFVDSISNKIIVSVDHFERLLTPYGEIQDKEIEEFFHLIANSPGSKLIITSRKKPFSVFLTNDNLFEDQPPFGRFPAGKHIENLLDDYIDRSNYDIDEYPNNLLDAIDRHPYLGMLAGLIIRKKGKVSIDDDKFMDAIRYNLREELLHRIIDDNTRPLVELIELLRVPVPRKMIADLTSVGCLQAGEVDGILYGVYDQHRDDLVKAIGPFRKFRVEEDYESEAYFEGIKERERDLHTKIASYYKKLYREGNHPRWLREAYYHTMMYGDIELIREFGVLYKTEIFWAADYWFRVLKKYEDALWAYNLVESYNLKTDYTIMRRCACLMRTNKKNNIEKGEKNYRVLIEKYPDVTKYKTSYIDSLLYLKKYGKALRKLRDYDLSVGDNAWITGEYGRAYFGLHRYKSAIDAFKIQMQDDQGAYIYDHIARAYEKIAEPDRVRDILEEGRRLHPNNNRLKLSFASYLIRHGDINDKQKAYELIDELYSDFPNNGRILLQYCHLLLKDYRVDDAKKLWKKHFTRIYPESYKIPIIVNILIAEERWGEALRQVDKIVTDDEVLIALKLRIYLAQTYSTSDSAKKIIIAKEGLSVEIDTPLENIAPIMITRAKLATIANDTKLRQKIAKIIMKINPELHKRMDFEDIDVDKWSGDIT